MALEMFEDFYRIFTQFLFNKMASLKTVYYTEQRVEIIKIYYQNGQNPTETFRKFKTKFGIHSTITWMTVKSL